MLEVLRKSPVLRLGKNKTVTLRNVRPPAKTLSLSAEAAVDASATAKATLADLVEETVEKNKNLLPLSQMAVALVFGPENGAVSQKLVFEAAKEAYAKSYAHLYVIGFAIQPTARELIEKCAEVVGVPATYVQATPDLLMGDLLKNMRSSQIFSVCGLPEVEVSRLGEGQYEVKLLGLDVFDPVTMDTDTRDGSDVPCWLLDTDYNDLCFHVSQAFFPRTGAWENLKRALRGEYDESVWAHLAGTTSAAFEAGENRKIAVKVIDNRGNELLVVKELDYARRERRGLRNRKGTGMILAYHSIFGMYGFWLPNDPRGSGSDYIASWELFRYGAARKTDSRRSVAHWPFPPNWQREARPPCSGRRSP